MKGMSSNKKYYFTATCGNSSIPDPSVRWGFIDSVLNGDTVRTGDYSAPVAPEIQLLSVTNIRVQFNVPSSFTFSLNTDSVRFYLGTDSAQLVSSYRTLTPVFIRDTAGARSVLSVDTLRNGSIYWLAVASRSHEGIWSNGVHIKKIVTGVTNTLTMKWNRINTSTIQIKIGGVSLLPQSATEIKLWNRSKQAGGFQLDSSAVADSFFAIAYPFASDTITHTISYSAVSNDTFCLSVTAGFTGNWASITDLNKSSFYVDNVQPINMLVLGATDSTSSSITYSVGNASFPVDVDSFWVWKATDSASLLSSFSLKSGFYATLPKSALLGNVVSGLNEMSRYWIGVALKDRMGNWSTTLSVVSRHTKPINPLSVTVSESGTNGILNVTIRGHRNLNSSLVDTVRLFYRSDASIFNPRSNDQGQLKLSLSLASVMADSVIIVNNMESETRYYFAVNERAVVNGRVLYGDIAESNKLSFTTGDYAEPQNCRILITSTTADSISLRLTDAQFISHDVASVFIYVGTNSEYLNSSYRTLTPVDTLTREEAIASSYMSFGGLNQGSLYYFAVAVKDSSGNWSTSLSIDSARTAVRNTLTPIPLFNPTNNRMITVSFSGVASLASKVDSVIIIYGQEQVIDPYAISVADTVISKQALTGSVNLQLPDGISKRYYVSVAPFISDGNIRWMSDIPPSSVGRVWYDSDEPYNPLGLRIADTTLTSISVETTNWAAIFGSDVDSVHFWTKKMTSSSDSVFLATMHHSTQPATKLSISSLIGGASALLSALDTGSTYYVAVAPIDTNGNYSTYSTVQRFKTASRPINPVSISGTTPYYSIANITLSNLNQLAANIERTKIKVILSTTGFVRNGYDSTDVRYFNVGIDSADRAFVVTGLKHSTKYFLTVAVRNTRGYWSRINVPANSCTLRTPVAEDTLYPNASFVQFSADTSPYQAYSQIAFKITGLDLLPTGDRYTGGVRVYWSEEEPYLDFQLPSKNVGYTDLSLATMVSDTFDGLVYPLLAGSIKSGQGKRYFLSMAVRDSAYNWDTVDTRIAMGWTRMDPLRPVNDTGWNPIVEGYSRINLNWNPTAFNKTGRSFRDTVPILGAWITTFPLTQIHIDTSNPTFLFDSGSVSPVSIEGLLHNTTYYSAFSPINTIGNRGAIVSGKSLFVLTTPFDSSTIAATPNLCSLNVSYTSVPESLKVNYSLSDSIFTDPVNGIILPVRQVMIRYRTDGVFPSGPLDGTLAKLVNITTTLTDSFKLYPAQLGAQYRFSAFVISSLSSTYPNRYSPASKNAQTSIRTWTYPVNNLAITRLVPQGGMGSPIRLAIDWRVASGAIPAGIRFLYKQSAGYDDVPAKYNAASFASFEPSTLAYSRRDTVPVVLSEQTKYLVAVFVSNTDGVWSKECKWDTITTPRGVDTVGPSKLPFELTTRVIDSRTVMVRWRIDPPLLYSAQYAENNKLNLLLDWNNSGPDFFLSPIVSRPYRDSGRITIQRPLDSILISDLEPNRDYYFGLTTADSVGNQARTDTLSVSFCRLTVPSFMNTMVKISLLDNERIYFDWSKLINTDTHLWKADSQVRYIAFVIQSDSVYSGPMPVSDASTSSNIFRCVDVSSGNYSERALRFDERDYYITFWSALERYLYPSDKVTIGPIRYKIDKPWLSKYEVIQVSDTVVRLILQPYDSTEREVQIRTTYSVGSASAYAEIPYTALRPSSSINLKLDTIISGTICTAYVHLNRLPSNEWNSIKGKDTVHVKYNVALSDMRPVTNLQPDTVYNFSLIADNRAPNRAEIGINYNRSSRRMVVTASSSNGGEFSALYWKTDAALSYKNIPFTGAQITVDTNGINRIFIRLIDSLGNHLDTAWEDFQSVCLPYLDSLYGLTRRFDNGSLSLEVPISALNSVSLNNGYLTVGLFDKPVDSIMLRSKGFVRSRPETYFLLSELRAASLGTSSFYNTGINLSFRLPVADTAVRLYRYLSGNKFEELGTIIDSSGKILRLQNFIPQSYWNSSSTASGSSNDTVYIVALRDLRAPNIDTVLTGLLISKKGDSGSVRIKVSDNNVRLDAGVRLFTFNPSVAYSDTVLWDTSTTAFSSGTRLIPLSTADSIVDCTFDVTSILRMHSKLIAANGVHLAFWVNDGRKRTWFHSASIERDSVVGLFASLRPNWSIISITANPDTNTNIVDAIPELNGEYNKNRIRIYRLDRNIFKEYARNDFAFRVVAGRSFIAMVRSDADASLQFELGKSKLPSVKNNKGFILASGGTLGGWNIVSLPFMGSVSQASIIAASRLDTTAGRASLLERMWVLRNNSFQLLNSVASSANSVFLRALKGYGDGILVYLYPNEELVAPIIDRGEFAFKRVLAKKHVIIPWKIPFSISIIGSNGSVSGVDALNALGVSSNPLSFADLSFPDAPIAGFIEDGELNAVSYKRNEGSGWIWKLKITNPFPAANGVRVDFADLDQLPEGIRAVIDVPDADYSVDIKEAVGLFSDNLGKYGSREYPIVIGDSAFIAKNSSQGKVPATFSLSGNYPNPFNPVTMINYQIPRDKSSKGYSGSKFRLDIFDIRGRLISSILNDAVRAGRFSAVWDARSNDGNSLASGLYVYRLSITDNNGRVLFRQSQKMTLIR
jgi:hypothetical protein